MNLVPYVVRSVGVTAVAAASFALTPLAGHAAPAFCSVSAPGTTTITWTGNAAGAHKHDWNDADNWDPAMVPDEAQDSSTYQAQYVCIGGGASVTIAKAANYHVAGIDVGEGAQLTVGSTGGIFLGAVNPADLVPSYVEKGSDLALDAATLGGNATINVAGSLDWTGRQQGIHRLAATQDGAGTTAITASGTLLVAGSPFGAAILAGTRTIDNSGILTIDKAGLISAANGTSLVDEPGSTLALKGEGGIYPNQSKAHVTLTQRGAIVKTGKPTSIIGVPTTFAKSVKPTIKAGGVIFDAGAVPTTKLVPNTAYGIGGCNATDRKVCRTAVATKATPQVAILRTSSQAPKQSTVRVALRAAPKQIKGHKVIGRSVEVRAPTAKTTHATFFTFDYDASLKGVGKANQPVFRGKHQITVCQVHGLTALNTSCVHSQKIVHGDLEITVISIQPNATWTVA